MIHDINIAWDALLAAAPERAREAVSAAIRDERWSRRALGGGHYEVSSWTAARFAVLRDALDGHPPTPAWASAEPRVAMWYAVDVPLARRLSRDLADAAAASIPASVRAAVRRMTYSSLAWGRQQT